MITFPSHQKFPHKADIYLKNEIPNSFSPNRLIDLQVNRCNFCEYSPFLDKINTFGLYPAPYN